MQAVHNIESPAYLVSVEADRFEDGIIAQAIAILDRRIKRGPVLSSPAVVREYLMLKAATHSDYEVFSVLLLDAQNQVIEFREMFRGTLTQTSVYPREVVKAALQVGACSVILTHNHPTGALEPSRADELLTMTLKSSLQLVDVKILDHIITGGGRSLSMAERGLI